MSFAHKLIGWVTGNGVEVDANNQLKVAIPNEATHTGKVRAMYENDDGTFTGNVRLLAPEVDVDYRLRCADDTILDDELFNYTAQNTGKHTRIATSTYLTPSWTNSGYNTNPTNVLTASSGATLQTYACFPTIGTGTLSADMELAFTNQPTSNTIIDFGFFLGAGSNPFAPTDGVYFRLNAAGLQGIANYNGTETSTGIFPLSGGTGTWTYSNNKKYQYILYITTREAQFWVNDGGAAGAILLGSIACPDGQGTLNMAAAVPFRIRHAIVGGVAGAGLSATLSRYTVRLGGVVQPASLVSTNARALGSYQGMSGGTMGSLQFGTVTSGSIVPAAAAVLSNTTAALGTGLGGLFRETATLAAGTDGIVMSYQVPAATIAVQGRRLVLYGINIQSYVQTVIAGGPMNIRYYLAYGHTNVSLATTESTIAKAPRCVPLPFVQTVTAAQAVNTIVAQANNATHYFREPIYVNPGEFIAVVAAKIGTAITAGVLDHNIVLTYGWE